MQDKNKANAQTPISTDLQKNIALYKEIYKDCSDIKMREMMLGTKHNVGCFLAYIEVAVSNIMMETTALGRLLSYLEKVPGEQINELLDKNAMGISDVTPFSTVEDAAQAMLTGDAILFVDGYTKF